MKTYKIESKVKLVKRLNNSVNGNPKFLLLINDELVQTKADYSYNYNIENLVNKNCVCTCEIYATKNGTLKLESIKELRA